jgi:hypothetical protein
VVGQTASLGGRTASSRLGRGNPLTSRLQSMIVFSTPAPTMLYRLVARQSWDSVPAAADVLRPIRTSSGNLHGTQNDMKSAPSGAVGCKFIRWPVCM